MANVKVVDLNGRATGSMDLASGIFETPVNGVVMHEVVLMQQAGRRQGTASTKTRGEVSGSGRKPYKQKHTGRARAGSIRSPIWRHGGIVFGPHPRDYSYTMPKKKVRAALHSALSDKLQEGSLIVVEEFPTLDGKTRSVAGMLQRLGLTGKTLLVAGADQDLLRQATGNLGNVTVVKPEGVNVRDILLHDKLLIARRDLVSLQEIWG
jgi:large subunit ribosomal protein L4